MRERILGKAIERVRGFVQQTRTDFQLSKAAYSEGVANLRAESQDLSSARVNHQLAEIIRSISAETAKTPHSLEHQEYPSDVFMPPADPTELFDHPLKAKDEFPHAPILPR